MAHKLVIFKWVEGVLEEVEHFFESVGEAFIHLWNSDAETAKIYDHHGNLVHCHGDSNDQDTYA